MGNVSVRQDIIRELKDHVSLFNALQDLDGILELENVDHCVQELMKSLLMDIVNVLVDTQEKIPEECVCPIARMVKSGKMAFVVVPVEIN